MHALPFGKNPYVTNPFAGHILPGTEHGLKLFLAGTKPLDEDKRFGLKPENAFEVISHLRNSASSFCWEKLTVIPVEYDDAGNPTKFVNLLNNPEDVTLRDCCIAAGVTFGGINPADILAKRKDFVPMR